MRLCTLFVLVLGSFACNNSSPVENETKESKDWALLPFVKADDVNPILVPDTTAVFDCPIIGNVKWEAKDVFNPAAVVRHDTVFLLYRAEDKVGKYAGTSRIGLAWSLDGLHFTKHPVPVLYPDNDDQKKYEWEGGCEDPRIVEDEKGIYYMTYTAYDGKTARLMVASSSDLYHWIKHGKALGFAFENMWSKSGAIVCRYENGKAIATKINGKYYMYWGDTDIFAAISDDLISWQVFDEPRLIIVEPRKKKFDSDLVESGPPAMLTDKGILLMYNSRNVVAKGDSSLPQGTYAASQILLDKNEPLKAIDRMDSWFMKPDKPYEMTGQVNNVCFIEGLAKYKGKWFLYYGTADSKIAVAVKQ